MPASSSVGLFAPIVFLVIVELANIARDINLKQMVDEKRPPLAIYGREISTNLGRFPLIHFGNMVLLAFTVFVTLHFTDGIATSGLLLGTSLLLYFLPLFEIEKYDEIISKGGLPNSYWKHLQWVSVIIGVSIPGVVLIYGFENLGLGPTPLLYLGVVFTVMPFFATRQFTSVLKDDLEELEDYKIHDINANNEEVSEEYNS